MTIDDSYRIMSLWSKLPYTKIINLQHPFVVEFVVDFSSSQGRDFLNRVTEITQKKHPSGEVCFLGHWGQGGLINSQYRKYRLEFIKGSSVLSEEESQKLTIFINHLEGCLKNEKTDKTGIQNPA